MGGERQRRGRLCFLERLYLELRDSIGVFDG